MSTESEKLNWYSKPSTVIVLLLIIIVLAFYIGTGNRNIVESPGIGGDSSLKGEGNNIATTSTDKIGFNDPRNGTYKFDGRNVTLQNGISEQKSVGSASDEIRIFGEPVSGDLNADGLNDLIFFVSEETGGTGVFFYVVAAVQREGKYYGTEAVFLGDRIAPQNITINNGIAAVNYATRREDEPMTAQPSLGVTKYFLIETGELMETQIFRD